jgi:hypothetical protein
MADEIKPIKLSSEEDLKTFLKTDFVDYGITNNPVAYYDSKWLNLFASPGGSLPAPSNLCWVYVSKQYEGSASLNPSEQNTSDDGYGSTGFSVFDQDVKSLGDLLTPGSQWWNGCMIIADESTKSTTIVGIFQGGKNFNFSGWTNPGNKRSGNNTSIIQSS